MIAFFKLFFMIFFSHFFKFFSRVAMQYSSDKKIGCKIREGKKGLKMAFFVEISTFSAILLSVV